jgi:hypothetical protein
MLAAFPGHRYNLPRISIVSRNPTFARAAVFAGKLRIYRDTSA